MIDLGQSQTEGTERFSQEEQSWRLCCPWSWQNSIDCVERAGKPLQDLEVNGCPGSPGVDSGSKWQPGTTDSHFLQLGLCRHPNCPDPAGGWCGGKTWCTQSVISLRSWVEGSIRFFIFENSALGSCIHIHVDIERTSTQKLGLQ